MGLSADHAAFVRFKDTMQTKHDEISRLVTGAESSASTLDGPAFKGGAGQMFKQTFQEFLRAANAMNETLMSNATNLEQVTKQFGSTEEDQISQLKAVNGSLPGGAPAPSLNMGT
ncbi:uncharacterized protein YukE [Nocardia transvalensis]|uniref:Uncharacterized protein YukE n=1 Tax=Nocardia transvalensis TaxID=37333 RepID=A0A7W9PBY3_9NOCA|nr:WXG100 family type VII secretion target [Nocardia transvalensis]MBB5912809.1 uncharacterized protein YukE [Nocardia transvalensis]